MGAMRFEDLEAWRVARDLVNAIYQMTRDEKLAKDFGLTSQLQRAAVSIMANISEGFERTGQQEKLHFYNIARSSCGEVRSLLYVVEDNFASVTSIANHLRPNTEHVGRIITGLIASTRRRSA